MAHFDPAIWSNVALPLDPHADKASNGAKNRVARIVPVKGDSLPTRLKCVRSVGDADACSFPFHHPNWERRGASGCPPERLTERAPTAGRIASVSQSLRSFSISVRKSGPTISPNVRENVPRISRRVDHHCAPLQIAIACLPAGRCQLHHSPILRAVLAQPCGIAVGACNHSGVCSQTA